MKTKTKLIILAISLINLVGIGVFVVGKNTKGNTSEEELVSTKVNRSIEPMSQEVRIYGHQRFTS